MTRRQKAALKLALEYLKKAEEQAYYASDHKEI